MSQALCPLFQFAHRRIPVQELSFPDISSGTARRQRLDRPAEPASSWSCKEKDLLSRKIIALKKCIDDRRSHIPPYCVSKLIQSTSCGYRFPIYQIATRYAIIHSSPRTHMVLGIVFRLAIPDWAAAFFPIKGSLPFFDLLSFLFYIKSAWESTTEKGPEPNAQNLVPGIFLHLRCDFCPVPESKDHPAVWIDRSVID